MDSVSFSNEGDELLGRFFREFLDEASYSEFKRIERLYLSMKSVGQTESGYPRLRPSDCAILTGSLSSIFESSRYKFKSRDRVFTDRFNDLVEKIMEFVSSIYPSEAFGLKVLSAEVSLFAGYNERAASIVEFYVWRPYLVEGEPEQIVKVVEIFAQAHLRMGTLAQQPISFIAFARWIAGQSKKRSSRSAGLRFAPFVNVATPLSESGLRAAIIRWASRRHLASIRGRSSLFKRAAYSIIGWLYGPFLTQCYRTYKRSGRFGAPYSLERKNNGTTLVTRAMGGIGDLIMMAPGLEALADRQKRPVDFAIPKKFFPIFEHNPNVNLIDIIGEPIDITQYKYWVNLSNCPAGRYESKKRPDVRKGRVEIFARAMRVSRRGLVKQGWRINQHLSQDDRIFVDRFLAEHGLGTRPLIGVQPYSRDSYKDHPKMIEIIYSLREMSDVLLFHHLADGLPADKGIVSTAGLPLGKSLALVSKLDVMVCVDSAFLHAAAAFDVPVTALFGPTDARTFTRHHKDVDILWKRQTFGCVPCWRNEDMPCIVTGQRSVSPCVAAIETHEVVQSVKRVLDARML